MCSGVAIPPAAGRYRSPKDKKPGRRNDSAGIGGQRYAYFRAGPRHATTTDFQPRKINGAAAPGYSTGQSEGAIAKVLNDQLPNGMKYEWTELTYQKILAGNTMVYIFPLSVFLVYLVLAARSTKLVVAPRHHPDCSDDSVFRHRRGLAAEWRQYVFTQIS